MTGLLRVSSVPPAVAGCASPTAASHPRRCSAIIATTPSRGNQCRTRPAKLTPRASYSCNEDLVWQGDQASPVASASTRRALLGAAASLMALQTACEVKAAGWSLAAAQGGAASGNSALSALMDGQEALQSALRINGTQGGARLRLRNLLPKYRGAVTTMTAYLPTVVDGTPSPPTDPGWVTAADNILIGASQVTAMAGFADRGEFDSFADADIPYSDIELAASSVQQILDQVPAEVKQQAMKFRCKKLLNQAADMDEMRDIANGPACVAAF